jgi:hypothetical protein
MRRILEDAHPVPLHTSTMPPPQRGPRALLRAAATARYPALSLRAATCPIHLGRMPAEVDNDEHLCLRVSADTVLHDLRSEQRRLLVDIEQDRIGSEVAHNLGGGREGPGGHKHLVARANAQRLEREVQRGRAGVDRARVPRAYGSGEARLELLRLASRRQPAALKDFTNQFELAPVADDAGKRDLLHGWE